MRVNVEMDLYEAMKFYAGLVEDKLGEDADKVLDNILTEVESAVNKADNVVTQRDSLLFQIDEEKCKSRHTFPFDYKTFSDIYDACQACLEEGDVLSEWDASNKGEFWVATVLAFNSKKPINISICGFNHKVGDKQSHGVVKFLRREGNSHGSV